VRRSRSPRNVLGEMTNDPRLELVIAGCIVRNGKVLLVWHKKHNEWLPPGGHIEQNETPNDAVLREVKEETGLDVEFMDESNGPMKYVQRQLALPFFADVHHAIDHDHCCFYYRLKPSDGRQSVVLNFAEVERFRWFSKSELTSPGLPEDIRHICRLALEVAVGQ